MDNNKRVIRDFFKNFGKQEISGGSLAKSITVDDVILGELCVFAQNIIYKAIEYRRKNPAKHDYTGNLLNSIVAAVYQNKELKKAIFSGETGIRQPRYYEMTASHNGNGHYHFEVDYEGKRSNYSATIETLRRKGMDDAYEFISTYTPNINGFVVVVAYTTDYADFVEMQRGTTGYLSTFKYAKKVATQMFQLRS